MSNPILEGIKDFNDHPRILPPSAKEQFELMASPDRWPMVTRLNMRRGAMHGYITPYSLTVIVENDSIINAKYYKGYEEMLEDGWEVV